MRCTVRFGLLFSLALATVCPASEIGFVEDFALAPDADARRRAVDQLIPGSEEYYYYLCLHYQNTGRFDKVEETLSLWVKRYRHTSRVEEIRNRQALLRYDEDPQETLAYLKGKLGLTFAHQREILGQKPNLPTRLDPKLIARETLKRKAFAEYRNLDGFEDAALDWLIDADLNPDRRRDVLRRLRRPDYSNLAQLVNADLDHRHSKPFGAYPIHREMLLEQLDELLALRPSLLGQTEFVNIYLTKLRPGPDVDWRRDPAEREAYLTRLREFVRRLPPAHNSLKAHVLFDRLVHDRSLGVYDRVRFMEYLKLPRQVPYMKPEYLRNKEHREWPARLGGNHHVATWLPRVTIDEPVVRDYLTHFFVIEDSYQPYAVYVRDTYLREVFAEAKILHGVGDMEEWYSLLNNPGRYQALKERVEIELAPTNKAYFRRQEPVRLELDVKNVGTLIVKVYEINTTAFYREQQREIDTGLNLDGLVANQETTHNYDEVPLRRVRRGFDLPALGDGSGRGVWVAEFIGGGKSSRALIRKGRLRFLERLSAAGHVFTVLDEDNRRLTDATLWLAGHEYTPEEDGTIVVPYTNKPGRQTVLITRGGFTTLDSFDHRTESYSLEAGVYVDRETLLKGGKARVLVRPTLQLSGESVSLELLEDAALVIESTDRDGVASSKEVKPFALFPDRESVYEFKVPENLAQLGFTLRGRVQSLSRNEKLDLADSKTFQLNQIDRTEKTEDLHLSRVGGGYALRLLGKTGEAKPDRAVRFTFKHEDFRREIQAVLQTDPEGRIELGELRGIVWLRSQGPQDTAHTWHLPRNLHTYPQSVHGRAGETISVPYAGSAAQTLRRAVSLLEKRGGSYYRDRLDAVEIRDGFVRLRGLPAGEYDLLFKESGVTIAVHLTRGEQRLGYALGENRLLEVRNPTPLQIASAEVSDSELTIRLANATAFTRVHVAATRFLPAYSAFHALAAVPLPEPQQVWAPKVESFYVSGRDIGDEYRYILERRYARKHAGNMLGRPSMLLNPWALRKTDTGIAEARPGEAMPSRGAPLGGRAARRPVEPPAAPPGRDTFANLDFLARPAAVLLNVKPEADGVVTIPRADLGTGQHLHILAVDPENTAYRQLALSEPELKTRDLRLANGLDPELHFTEQKLISVIGADEKLELGDITTSQLELYDTLREVYRLYTTLSNDAHLLEFGFLLDWPRLKPEERRAKYSEYACHELNFFLYHKDPQFFAEVVRPYLENKQDKTFLDRWLIGEDLSEYVKPWAYGQLNIVERILLARRLAGESAATARHVQDLLDLIPPDIDRFNHLFLTALKGSALETGDALGLEGAKTEALQTKQVMMMKRKPEPRPALAPAAPPPPERRTILKKVMQLAGPRARKQVAAAERTLEEAAESEGDDRAGQFKEDLARRDRVRPYYRKLDKTQEWAENNYYHLPIEQQNDQLVTVNAFWADYARHHGAGPFFSIHWAEASRNFTEMMFALSVLDFPFDAAEHQAAYDGPRMTLTAESPLIAFHKEIRESEPADGATPILVSQNFFRLGDRYRHEGGERYDKFVTGEFLVHVVYGCQVVLTNPTSSPLKLDMLLQIPDRALPVRQGFYTRGRPVRLDAYATTTFEYHFYFPTPGVFTHYPVHVARNERLIGSAPAVTLKVVETPTVIDTTSWDYVSQNGTPDEVLTFLERDNPNRLDLNRIAWRMRERGFFEQVTGALARRHVYDHTLWSYGIQHGDPGTVREYLQHAGGFLGRCGDYLVSPLVTIDPVVRKTYQHLEYKPLVNARAHQLGKRRKILNQRFFAQYHALLTVLRYRPQLDDADRMAVAYYLLLQDRVDEAIGLFDRVDPANLETRVQYDYLRAYLGFFAAEPGVARAVAESYRDYPVDRWRKAFQDVLSQLDEVQGKAPAVVDEESRGQVQARLAATEAALDLAVESKRVTVGYQNLTEVQVNYYLMDVELLFSRNPFVEQVAGQFSYVQPNRSETVQLPAGRSTFTFDLPREFHSANVLVEIAGEGLRKSQAYFAHSLALQVIENYGHLRVTHKTTGAPLAKVYVKVYARMNDRGVRFYRDGYTDLRGRFDYTSLSTDELDRVEKLAILVLSEADGAVVQEAQPPKR